MTDNINTKNDYSDDGFWNKVVNYAKDAGYELIEKSLWLYYAAQSDKTPMWAKSIIYSALAYFILPIDAIPDAIPVVGYTDDLGALAAALGSVTMYIDKDVKSQASAKLTDWFD
ncbi:YkvA family protein [Providencia stuartii]|uniref:DUF1232 domain-containing protein n=2 Tax=Providencia TaxID=586 RepID=A0ABD5LA38_PROST|nr:YkvA family protein [Providencia stuartii]MCX3072585.1 YkvA family protein [Providencia stuartii]MDT7048388.1 YkvA family protein [Providencia stuartii]